MAETADLKALSRRWFDEVWTRGNTAVIDELLAADGVAHGLGAGGMTLRGPADFRRFYDQFRQGFSRTDVTVDDVIAEGDRTATRFTVRAVHDGPGFGVAPTGRTVTVTGLCIMRWRDGRIAEAWNEFDVAGMMAQIGLPPGTDVRVR